MITLNNGVKMPQVGFGVYQISNHVQCKEAVLAALEAGYRHIDTAQFYQNETAVGEAIEQSGIDRSEIFITTKIWPSNFGYDKTSDALEQSCNKLNTRYIDLVLLHQPVGNYLWAYKALEEAQQRGIVRAIGVSNFERERLVDLAQRADVVPQINQIENHVFYQRTDLIDVMKSMNIQYEAWAPFAQGRSGIFTHPELTQMGAVRGKTAGQVALRFLVQTGAVIIPKSVYPERMRENIDIWDFELTDGEMERIRALDTGRTQFSSSRLFERISNAGLFTAKVRDCR